MRRRTGCIVAAVCITVLAGAAVFFMFLVNSFLQAPVSNSVASADSRVCPGTSLNNLPLGDATSAFHLTIPSGVTQVKFTANSDFQGHDSLDLRFTTTAAGLRSFLTSAVMPAPSQNPGRQDLNNFDIDFPAQCGSPPPHGPHLAYAQDPGTSDYYGERDVLIDLADPARPEVWVSAMQM